MSTANVTPGKQTALVDRINDLQGRANTAMACPRCNGTWFYKVTVEQFSDGGYGSAQFRSLSMTPETAYVCLCGAIVENKESVGRGVDSRHGYFLGAIRTALECQKRNSVQQVAASCASIEEVEELRDRVKWLEEAITSFTTDQTPIEGVMMTEAVNDSTRLGHMEEQAPVVQADTPPIELADVAYAPPVVVVAPAEKISKPVARPRTGRPAKVPDDIQP